MNNGVGTVPSYYFPPPIVLNNVAYYDTPYFSYYHTIFPEPFVSIQFDTESVISYGLDDKNPETKKKPVKSSCFSCFYKKKSNL